MCAKYCDGHSDIRQLNYFYERPVSRSKISVLPRNISIKFGRFVTVHILNNMNDVCTWLLTIGTKLIYTDAVVELLFDNIGYN